jgi:L-alanine-DL-glutamate epimerase-like enolase superfamily enzyme
MTAEDITLALVRRLKVGLKVGPGEVLAVTLDWFPQPDESEAIVADLREALPDGVKVLLLTPGTTLDVIAAP